MRDVFEFHSPLGVLGKIVDALLLKRYLSAFLAERNDVIKSTAESDRWRSYLHERPNPALQSDERVGRSASSRVRR